MSPYGGRRKIFDIYNQSNQKSRFPQILNDEDLIDHNYDHSSNSNTHNNSNLSQHSRNLVKYQGKNQNHSQG